ncbi:selenocysteine-specific translation elongation factor [Campylobacter sp.]|uniref:selenocysteine-specific translation elongation factor n=1 Tax=Campylobacter sp. TaxID=205 RepID=UPI002A693DB6|nr:selenocysteine-specific translation elongation factor [Campylobacter sp.]MDD7704368.1 selenocysteine-specific translation elongation factor [Campylobacteraceae bacterium]MDY2635063.1 selenocysteine-specific translation elongation factor [Campylobacter sp.]
MSSILLASAGHIDHGKTALIKALNGFEGDSTDEEKRRGITIDLSFSHLEKNGANIAFIDVPGHENLLKTMISGAFGAQGALLVVSSTEGLKAQSLEHIKILEFLGIKKIILCITKCDIASKEQISHSKSASLAELRKYDFDVLKSFELSIFDSSSIEALRQFLLALRIENAQNSCLPRYYIDRLFNIKGAGLVATGTLLGSSIELGGKLYDYDAGVELGIRSMQVHDKPVSVANNAQRVAINISSPLAHKIKKGDFISKKGNFRGFKELDCVFFGSITHGAEVSLCIGTKSINAKASVLSSKKEGEKNESYFITLKLDKEVFASFDERFVLLGGGALLGGGRVLNPISEPLKKRAKIELLTMLLEHDFLGAFELLKNTHEKGFGLLCAAQRFGILPSSALKIAKELKNAIIDEDELNVYDASAKESLKDFIRFIISKNELAMFSASSVALKLPWASKMLAGMAINEMKSELDFENGLYFKKGADFSKLKESLEEGILREIERGELAPLAPYNIYDIFECDRKAGDDALKRLTARGVVIRLEHNLFISAKNLDLAKKRLFELIARDGYADVSNAKDFLNLSRKYTIAYLEALDNDERIEKIENKRVLKS